MRSRYSAYVCADSKYLLSTWHPATRPQHLELQGAGAVKWLGLKIVRAERGGANDNHGIVEFVARYKIAGKAHRMHETSRFERLEGRWFYVDGQG